MSCCYKIGQAPGFSALFWTYIMATLVTVARKCSFKLSLKMTPWEKLPFWIGQGGHERRLAVQSSRKDVTAPITLRQGHWTVSLALACGRRKFPCDIKHALMLQKLRERHQWAFLRWPTLGSTNCIKLTWRRKQSMCQLWGLNQAAYQGANGQKKLSLHLHLMRSHVSLPKGGICHVFVSFLEINSQYSQPVLASHGSIFLTAGIALFCFSWQES